MRSKRIELESGSDGSGIPYPGMQGVELVVSGHCVIQSPIQRP